MEEEDSVCDDEGEELVADPSSEQTQVWFTSWRTPVFPHARAHGKCSSKL